MICEMVTSDISLIVDEGKKFFAESRFNDYCEYSPERVAEVTEAVLKGNGIGLIDREKKAFFLGNVDQHFFSPMLYAYDLYLWVPKEHRGKGIGYRLLKKYVEEAEAKGAKEIFLGDIADIDQTTLFRIHQRLGLEYRSKVYSKVIGE